MSETISLAAYGIVTSPTAWAEIRESVGRREVSPETARTVASWYQSSGSVGRVLAALATGADVFREWALEDIAATRRDFPRDYQSAESNWLALDMLATFVTNYTEEG